MGTDTRAFSILFGVAVATAPVRTTVTRLVRAHRSVAQVGLLAIVTAGVIVWSSVDGASSGVLFEGGLAAHAALGAVLIVCCAADDGLLAARLFSGNAARLRRHTVVRVVPVALARLRRARCGPDGSRRPHAVRGSHRRLVRARRDLVPHRRDTGPPSRAVGARPERRRRHDVRIRGRGARLPLGAAGDRRHRAVRPAGDRSRLLPGTVSSTAPAQPSPSTSRVPSAPPSSAPAAVTPVPAAALPGIDRARDHDHPPAAETVVVERAVDG